jgi:diguanylate cyclase (GGDEF)-like protein
MRKNLKHTLDELTDTQVELKNLNQSLEKKVSDRTLELAQKNKELELLSITDRLTGLYNRRYLDQKLTGELSRSKRAGQSFGIILMDVDHFKMINDTYGHQEGDHVLQEVGTILHKWTRKTDIVSRWGGEEFMVVCPDTDQTGVLKLAEELRKAMELYDFRISAGITASFGTTSLHPGDTVEMMVARADTALYLAKEKGRNRVEQHMPLQQKFG